MASVAARHVEVAETFQIGIHVFPHTSGLLPSDGDVVI
jgi:hypothetical protein